MNLNSSLFASWFFPWYHTGVEQNVLSPIAYIYQDAETNLKIRKEKSLKSA